jgi:hypothetical protein
LCRHPSLTLPSQIALTLRAVGGLSTDQIAHGFLVPSSAIGQRISRAKATLRGARFELLAPDDLPDRVAAVATVIYLVFTEGHTASSGTSLDRVDLADEAVRLGRPLLALVSAHPALEGQEGEVAGLLSLMLLTHSRRAARTDPHGDLVLLADQDRRLWDRALIDEGIALIESALSDALIGLSDILVALAPSEYELAARLTHSVPERPHLLRRAARLLCADGLSPPAWWWFCGVKWRLVTTNSRLESSKAPQGTPITATNRLGREPGSKQPHENPGPRDHRPVAGVDVDQFQVLRHRSSGICPSARAGRCRHESGSLLTATGQKVTPP